MLVKQIKPFYLLMPRMTVYLRGLSAAKNRHRLRLRQFAISEWLSQSSRGVPGPLRVSGLLGGGYYGSVLRPQCG